LHKKSGEQTLSCASIPPAQDKRDPPSFHIKTIIMTDELEYNSTREKLLIPEYGRNIQKMIHHIKTVDDKDKRTRMAHAVVAIMAQMNPQQKEATDLYQKLWDHLHIIAGFDLDIDSPYPPPQPETLDRKPSPIAYSTGGIRYSQYGKHIQNIIEKVAELEDGEEKTILTRVIANHLKKSYLSWNRDSVTDELIVQHLAELSKGRLQVTDDMKLLNTNEILARNAPPPSQQPVQRKKKFSRDNRPQGNNRKRPARNN